MANDELQKSIDAAEKEQIIALLNNAIGQLEQEQSKQKAQILEVLNNAIERLNKEQATQKAKVLEVLDNAIKKLAQKQFSQKEKMLKLLDNAISKLSSTAYKRPKDSVFKRLYNFFVRPKKPSEEPSTSTPAIPYYFEDFSMQDDLSDNGSNSSVALSATNHRKQFPNITIEIDLEGIEQDPTYGIPIAFYGNNDEDEDTDTTSSTVDTDISANLPPPIIPPPVILNTTPVSNPPLHPPILEKEHAATKRDPVPPIINTVVPTNPVPHIDNSTTPNNTNSRPTPPSRDTKSTIINPVAPNPTIPTPIVPRTDNSTNITTQNTASSSVASNFLPPYLQRQQQQEKVGNKIINLGLMQYLHNKEIKKSKKFNDSLNNNQQLHENKYSTGEGSQVFKFNENAASIYKNVTVSELTTMSQQYFEVSNNNDSKVKVSLAAKPNVSKLMIQSQSENSIDLMLSITMETKKQLGSKANMKIYVNENIDEKYIKELIELLAKSISLGLNIALLPPKNHLHPEQYTSIITSIITRATATAPKIDPRLLPTQSLNRR